MKRFTAQYIITNLGSPLKRAIITTEDDGTVIDVEDNLGELQEKHSVEFYNGIIIPGFVNCHCHLELSHMKDSITPGHGLTGFIEKIRNTRTTDDESIISKAKVADLDMYVHWIPHLIVYLLRRPASQREPRLIARTIMVRIRAEA